MNRVYGIIGATILLLIMSALTAGCTSSDSSGTGSPSVVTTAPPANTPLYTTGDIVRSAKAGPETAWLILGYKSGTDAYERAFIYRNDDGTWGYRVDSRTETLSRPTLEKINTVKVTNVDLSKIPVRSASATITQAAATVSTTSVTSQPTVTTTSYPAPRIKMIDPDKGKTGTTVSITGLAGENFRIGANVTMKRSGEPTLTATDVSVTPILISAKFALPSDMRMGYWDIVVTNLDGQYHQYQNGFLVLEGTATPTPGTTVSGTSGMVKITQIQDTLIVTGGTEGYKTVSILGNNVTAASSMKLTGPTTITATTYTSSSSSLATGYFTIPAGNVGTYYVNLVDSSGNILATSTSTLTIQ